jgi:hypothetical protein
MVDNMQQICDVMEVMTGCVDHSDQTTKAMLSKYTETASNIDRIETTIGNLMEQLGAGGFMGVHDIREGMTATLLAADKRSKIPAEYKGVVTQQKEKDLIICLDADKPVSPFSGSTVCTLKIIVENILYEWSSLTPHPVEGQGSRYILFHITTNPSIMNRRKFARLPLSNNCTITLKKSGQTFDGRMINISANGFAFSSPEKSLSHVKEEEISVTISDFGLPEHNVINGTIIRSTENAGNYIVGCRMPEDNIAIQKYVKRIFEQKDRQ